MYPLYITYACVTYVAVGIFGITRQWTITSAARPT